MSVSCEAPGCTETALEPGCDAHDTYDGHDEHFWCAAKTSTGPQQNSGGPMADSERLALADRLDTEHQHRSPWGTLGCTCPVCPDLRAAAGALREARRPRGAAFENTERDRLAWRDRAWKAESERDAALAEVERLIADGQQDAPIVDDATRQEVPEVLVTFAKWADWYLDDGCRRDHHGYCQSHGLDKDCPVGPMREWLAAYLGRTD